MVREPVCPGLSVRVVGLNVVNQPSGRLLLGTSVMAEQPPVSLFVIDSVWFTFVPEYAVGFAGEIDTPG
jgi:hypothetical protein